ncbi:MAG: sigma-54-dependent Fis family transcriptional regulator [Calditrichaeota bacterium]|nr:MAG: sigma-54-dependent Fis family transcriptional regulator [Calditrichota bacterium]
MLIVDDEPNIHYSFAKILPQEYSIISAHDAQSGIDKFKRDQPDVVVMDIKMPGMSGLDALTKMREIDARIPIIMMTAFGTLNTAITAMKNGAFDYLLKPFDLDKMRTLIKNALHNSEQMRRSVSIPAGEKPDTQGDTIVGQSEAMQEVYKLIGQVAGQDVTVLIRGESGTGKELVARAIYQYSKRAARPFLEVNCAALSENLLESELFGHEKGAFTGAHNRHIGKFEQVDGGTLFLDEIGEMSLTTQAKILRVIQHGEISRLGGKENIRTNIRLIAATHSDIEAAIRAGKFREDLYYRLNIIQIQLPALRERREDIADLVNYFIVRHSFESGKKVTGINKKALQKISEHPWPGNVRELENCIRRAVVLAKSVLISADEIDLEPHTEESGIYREADNYASLEKIVESIMEGKSSLKLWPAVEKILIKKTLEKTERNQVQAARILGIHRNTLRNRIEKYGL